MAKKARQQFLCNNCGGVQPKWMGKCPDCGAWDALEPFTPPTEDVRAPRSAGTSDLVHAAQAVPIGEVDASQLPRFPTGVDEFDRVLGGGIVSGAVILVGGEPGIGKSTLLLQMAASIAGGLLPTDRSAPSLASSRKPVAPQTTLYITSEESAAQTRLRARRLGADASDLLVLAETNLERILHQIAITKAKVVVVDSIQMIYKPDMPAAPGSVTQLRECCTALTYLAKSSGVCIFLVGHVTKAGTLAGPKIVEHMVDTVVYFEGDRYHSHRIVRCVKNRFGSTHELGLFEMTGEGLLPVEDPGQLFAQTYGPDGAPSGSVLTCAMQGSRCLLVEVQALTANSVIGAARRKVTGLPGDRVAMIIAVLEKRCGYRLADQDIFVNVAGGVKLIEPAIDLPVAMAIASAYADQPLPTGTMAVGELGLGGEVRQVSQLEQRLKEASRLGVGHSVIPFVSGNLPKLGGMAQHPVRRVQQALASIQKEKKSKQ